MCVPPVSILGHNLFSVLDFSLLLWVSFLFGVIVTLPSQAEVTPYFSPLVTRMAFARPMASSSRFSSDGGDEVQEYEYGYNICWE